MKQIWFKGNIFCKTRQKSIFSWILKFSLNFLLNARFVKNMHFCYLWTFLHSPFCRAEGLCQQAVIKVHLRHHHHKMLNEPIRAKQVNQSSSVIGWQNRGQAGTSECTLAQCRCVHSPGDWNKIQMYRSKVWVGSVHFSENWGKQSACITCNSQYVTAYFFAN